MDIGRGVRLEWYGENRRIRHRRRSEVATSIVFARSVTIRPRGRRLLGGVMRVIGRLLIALAIAFPISVIVVGVAHGDSGEGPAVIKCMHWKDVVKIAPGVGNEPSDQGVTGHGKLYGCNKAGGAAQFSGTFQISGATCSNPAMTGSGQLEWADGGHSTLFLSFEPQDVEPRKVFVTGTVTSGAFQGLIARVAPVHAGVRGQRRELRTAEPPEEAALLEHAELPTVDAERAPSRPRPGHDPTTAAHRSPKPFPRPTAAARRCRR